ncbi:MAG: LEA type 2 family protein [Flavobacteriales bacterium]|nr:LEA type 2 family protein [Flavobacteriales bacterium]
MKIRVLLYSSVVFLLSSCIMVKPLEVRSVVCCDLKKAMKTEAEVAFMVELHNPNDFPINVKSYCLDVRLNNNTLGTAESKEVTEIPPNKTLNKSVTIKTSAQKLVSGSLMMGLSALLKNDLTTLEVEIVGSVVGNAKGFSKRVRIREKYPLKLNP